MTELRFLVVDDSSVFRHFMRTLLKIQGFRKCDEAQCAVSALKRIRDSDHDIIIASDLNGLSVNDLRLLRRGCKDEGMRNIPMLLVTGESKQDAMHSASILGAFGYIVAPFARHAF
jgi:two-component system chemotaxis response regulator CheY